MKNFISLLVLFKLGFIFFKRVDSLICRKYIDKLSKGKKGSLSIERFIHQLRLDSNSFEYKPFYNVFYKALNFSNRSVIIKILKISGVLCVLLNASELDISGDNKTLILYIAFLYLIYNLTVSIFNLLNLFSKIFFYTLYYKFVSLCGFYKTHRFAFLLGLFTHFLLDFLLQILVILFKCFIIDMYLDFLDIKKVF